MISLPMKKLTKRYNFNFFSHISIENWGVILHNFVCCVDILMIGSYVG